MIYNYTQATSPDSQGILTGIAASAMTDKVCSGVTWDDATSDLAIEFPTTLSAGDKTILDGIVASPPVTPPTSVEMYTSEDGSKWGVCVDDAGILVTNLE